MKRIIILYLSLLSTIIQAQHRSHGVKLDISPSAPKQQVHSQKYASHNSVQTFQNVMFLDYASTEFSCWINTNINSVDSYIWQMNSRSLPTDSLLTEAGESFISWIDNNCIPYSPSYSKVIGDISLIFGQENNSGTNDTIVVYLQDVDTTTGRPQGGILWSDTIIQTPQLASFNWLMNLFQYTASPMLNHSGGFMVGVKYYGSPVDTFGVIESFPNVSFSPPEAIESEYGRSFRKLSAYQTYGWLPDATGFDLYYDRNSNSIYDLGTNEASYCQIMMCTATVFYNSSRISGVVYKDLNNNGVRDSGEPGKVNLPVAAGSYVSLTDTGGHFDIYVDTGSYTVQPTIQGYYTFNPSSVPVSFSLYGQTTNIGNIGTEYIANVKDLSVDLTTNFRYRPGFKTGVYLMAKNKGTVNLNSTVYFKHDPLITNLWSYPQPDAINGDTLSWNLGNLIAEDSIQIYLFDSIAPTVPLNTVLYSSAWIDPTLNDSVPSDNSITVADTVVSSFDPNDKTPEPKGTGPTGLISANQQITYTIRFQNTGTFPASKVEVVDTIDTDLDLSSFQMISSSHSCTYKFLLNNKIVWTFDPIQLPDSNSNEPASHGFIKYSIKPMTGIQPGTQITNTGYIYFDFNSPVITNTSLNTIINPNSVPIIGSENKYITIYPNPSSNWFNLSINADIKLEDLSLTIFDVTGREMQTNKIAYKNSVIHTDGLNTGIYFYKLNDRNGAIAAGKIIIY